VVRGESTSGKSLELEMGVDVTAPPLAQPSSVDLRPWLAAGAGAILLGGALWFLVAWRRRRDDEEEPALIM
jgi:hypothetical protein